MRRSRLASALVMIALALGTVVGLATPASAQSVSGSDCATKKFRILFWPKGHPAVPSAGFPAFPTPHVEVYMGTGKKFPDTQEVGYIDATHATVSSKPPCTATTSTSTNGTQNKKVTKTKEVD